MKSVSVLIQRNNMVFEILTAMFAGLAVWAMWSRAEAFTAMSDLRKWGKDLTKSYDDEILDLKKIHAQIESVLRSRAIDAEKQLDELKKCKVVHRVEEPIEVIPLAHPNRGPAKYEKRMYRRSNTKV